MPANEVDHVVPRWQGGTSHMSNLVAINSECHKRKTQMEIGNQPRPTIGLDGWPLQDQSRRHTGGGYLSRGKRRL